MALGRDGGRRHRREACSLRDDAVRAGGADEGARAVGVAVRADGDIVVRDLDLTDGKVIKFGNQELEILNTPGHTDGASCFRVGKHLFSGDTLFPGGPGKTRSPEALAQVLNSITSKLLPLPDDTAVYPGHGDDTTIGEARRRYTEFSSKSHPADMFGDVDWLTS